MHLLDSMHLQHTPFEGWGMLLSCTTLPGRMHNVRASPHLHPSRVLRISEATLPSTAGVYTTIRQARTVA